MAAICDLFFLDKTLGAGSLAPAAVSNGLSAVGVRLGAPLAKAAGGEGNVSAVMMSEAGIGELCAKAWILPRVARAVKKAVISEGVFMESSPRSGWIASGVELFWLNLLALGHY